MRGWPGWERLASHSPYNNIVANGHFSHVGYFLFSEYQDLLRKASVGGFRTLIEGGEGVQNSSSHNLKHSFGRLSWKKHNFHHLGAIGVTWTIVITIITMVITDNHYSDHDSDYQ